ncbi:ParB N-terminal domain-containing protein [Lentzea sp. NPDC034063]|uniref:ParB/RepB/Spo0J family partition protein n=1 Tax=unclassified Lentzea TaxID=2643253 RepID=UPI0033F69B1B
MDVGFGEVEESVTESVRLDLLSPGESPRFGGQDEGHVSLLAETFDELPPILVHRPTMQVIDGLHRLSAAKLRGVERVDVQYFDGTLADAFLIAVERNVAHGLPLSRRDRAAAAARVIGTHPHLSNRVIAGKVGLSDKTVAALRRSSSAEIPEMNRRMGLDGRVRPTSAAEGRVRAAEFLGRKPDASLREIAAEAGIAVATARDVRQRVVAGEDPVPAQRRASSRSEMVRPAPVPPSGDLDDAEYDVEAGAAAISLMLAHLRNDPSLRFSETGRVILRLFDAHSMNSGNWLRLIDQVPPHCARTVAEAADRCADVWRYFAVNLNRRSSEM